MDKQLRSAVQSIKDLALTTGLPTLAVYPFLGVGTGVATGIYQQHPKVTIAVTSATTFFGVVRYFFCNRILSSHPEQLPRWRFLHHLSVYAVACSWSVYSSWAVVMYGRTLNSLEVLFTTIGIVAGATSTLTPNFGLMVGYIAVMLLPSVVAMATIGEPGDVLTAIMLLGFMVFIIVSGRNHHIRYTTLSSALYDLEEVQKNREELLRQEQRQTTLLARQNQELQEAREESERASRSKSFFLATMSHEIRTPMNAIVGITTLLLQTELSDHQRKWLQTLQSSSESLLLLISDILDMSKIEAQQMKVQASQFSLRDLCTELVHLLEPVAELKDIAVATDFVEPLPLGIETDRLKLHQILLNLLGNAVKFSNRGTVTLRVEVAGENLRFAVWDQGIGIAPSKFRLLFQAFSQVDSGSTRLHEGSGLGLVISQQLAQLLGGRLWLSSGGHAAGEVPPGFVPPDVGSGSQFWVEIPKLEVSLSPTLEVRIDEALRPLKILVAEDNRVNQKVILELLSRMGHQVSLSENGEEAVKAVAAQQFEVILMDLQMPRLDGLEATRRIRQCSGQGPWIIALTANAFMEDRERCIEAGMNDYLSKPVRVEELTRALLRAQQRDR